jgi:hypothetical protein
MFGGMGSLVVRGRSFKAAGAELYYYWAGCGGLYRLSCYKSLALVKREGETSGTCAGGACVDRACIDGACVDKVCIGGACADKACINGAYIGGACVDGVTSWGVDIISG